MSTPSLHDSLKAIAKLDLDRVREKAARRHGWDEERAKRAEQSYKRYLCLLAENHGRVVVPWSEDLDDMWHEHILDTHRYGKDCEAIFGRFIHHDPHISGRPGDHERATLYTRRLYKKRFILHERPEHHSNLFSRLFDRGGDREIDDFLDALDVLDFEDWTGPAVMSIIHSYDYVNAVPIDSDAFNDASVGMNSDGVCVDANMDGVCDADAGGEVGAGSEAAAGGEASSCGGAAGGDGGGGCGGGGGGCGGGGD